MGWVYGIFIQADVSICYKFCNKTAGFAIIIRIDTSCIGVRPKELEATKLMFSKHFFERRYGVSFLWADAMLFRLRAGAEYQIGI